MLPESALAPALLEAMSEAVYVVDRDRTITYWNPAAEQLTGFPAAEVVGKRCRDGVLNHVDDAGRSLCRHRCPLLATMRDGASRDACVFLHHRDGHRVPVEIRAAPLRGPAGAVIGAVEVFHDDTRRREQAERLSELEQRALTDSLTGLGNRRRLLESLARLRDEQRRYGRGFAVLFADIDHFKAVNDHFGHDAGDRVLKMVATTLRGCTRGSDEVGRWGGEEFLVVGPAEDVEEVASFADRLRQLVGSGWVRQAGKRVRVTISAGVALAQPDEDIEAVVARADAAMYASKQAGRNRTTVS